MWEGHQVGVTHDYGIALGLTTLGMKLKSQPFMTCQDLSIFQTLKYPVCCFVTITEPNIEI